MLVKQRDVNHIHPFKIIGSIRILRRVFPVHIIIIHGNGNRVKPVHFQLDAKPLIRRGFPGRRRTRYQDEFQLIAVLRDVIRHSNKFFFLQTFRHTDNLVSSPLPDNPVQFGNRITADHGRPFFCLLIGTVNAPHRVPGRQRSIIVHLRIVNDKSFVKRNQFKGRQMFRACQQRFKKRFPYPTQFIGKKRFGLRRHVDHRQYILPQIGVLLCPFNRLLPVYRECYYRVFCCNDAAHFIFQLLQLPRIQRIFRHGTVQGAA